MFDIGTTRMSSKGQIVLPADLREDFKEGDKFVVIRKGPHVLLQKVSAAEQRFAEDVEFARRTAQAWKEIEQGKFTTYKNWEEMQAHLDKLKAPSNTPRLRSTKRTKS